MGLVQLGHQVLPLEGVDPNDMDALAKAMPDMGPEYFIFPFLAHAVGTFAGAIVAAWIATGHKMKFALGIGLLFLIFGIAVNIMLPGPLWFSILDVLVAYIPMAWLGGKIGISLSGKSNV